jgi:methionyl-tRNA synthetase
LRFAGGYGVRRFSLTAVASTMAEQLARLDQMAAGVTKDNAGDLCHEVDVFLRCAAPVLIDLAAAALPDNTIPARPDAESVTPTPLPRLTGAGG